MYYRYAHTAQVIDDALVLISGVNLRHNPPGIAVINLMSGACAEYSLPVSNFEQNDNIHVYIPNCLYCNVMNLKKTVKFKQKIKVKTLNIS
jgi:hypothetical protein